MANAPLFGTEWLKLVQVICPTGQSEYFFREDWTGRIALIVKENLVCARTANRKPKQRSRRSPVGGEKFERFLAGREATKLAVIRIVLRRLG
jgi:hypothetical protein